MEFECEEHFYINGKSYNVTSVVSMCKPNGEFQNSGELEAFCKEKPCEQDDIDYITSTTGNGTSGVEYMKTKAKGYTVPNFSRLQESTYYHFDCCTFAGQLKLETPYSMSVLIPYRYPTMGTLKLKSNAFWVR